MNYREIIHWTAFIVFTYIFGYASIYKVIQLKGMMEGMASMGFGEEWTLVIGWAELIGFLGLLASLYYPPCRSMAVLWLWPFAIGAFTVHMSYHHTFGHYLNSLLVCVLPVLLLCTDRYFRIQLIH